MSRDRVPGDGPKCWCGAEAIWSGHCAKHCKDNGVTIGPPEPPPGEWLLAAKATTTDGGRLNMEGPISNTLGELITMGFATDDRRTPEIEETMKQLVLQLKAL